jgi:hypothetical protein
VDAVGDLFYWLCLSSAADRGTNLRVSDRCQHHEQIFFQKPLGFVPLSTSTNIMTLSLLGASGNVRKTWDVGVSINGLNFHFRRT